MLKDVLVIKLGGALIENDSALTALYQGLKDYLARGNRPIVLVHGGGCLVDDLLKGLNMKSEKKNGLRVTPFSQIPYITGALAGTANKLMLAKARSMNVNAVGLCLSDANITKVTQLNEELGAVGAATIGDPKLLEVLLENGYMPTISSIGFTDDGKLMNVNADQAAVALAISLKADLALLSDVDGILDKDGKLIEEMTEEKAQNLIKDGTITGGMEVKVKAALKAAKALNKPLSVASWRYSDKISALLNGEAIGTKVMP
ncbi:MAG: acetylglutamate kinase [Succinivibrionaceae bacterium]|nr:acetylglutamate kinase [Succinivibrionaceae bacterium]MEE1339690.1 acetylglutamate kinase [Succinivibrionaceae bacterium]